MSVHHRPDSDPPGNVVPSPTHQIANPFPNFVTMLELFRAQRDSQVLAQAAPPSPSLAVRYHNDIDSLPLGDILSSQITFVTDTEFEQLRQLVPSQQDGVPLEAMINATRIALPYLSTDLLISSIGIMENIGAHTDISSLPVAAVPPEIWAALRAGVPSQGSRLSEAVASSPAFSTARVSLSGQSSPMDDSPVDMTIPPLFLEASASHATRSNNEDNPIWVSSGSEMPHDNRQVVNDRMRSFSVDYTPGPHSLSPSHTTSPHADNRAVSSRAMITAQNSQDNFLDALMTSDSLLANAETAVTKKLEELNIGVEGYSHYFLSEPLTLCDEPAIEVASPHLRRILDIAGAALSMGPRDGLDGDTWRMLRPSDWFRASTYILAAVLRGCVRTPKVARMGNFPLRPLRDSFLYGNDLPELESQTDALRAMAAQIIENLELDNGPTLPQDSIEGIRSTVWRTHEAHIRAIVEQEALQVEHRLSTMGLSDLIDKLERDAPIEDITDVLRDDILEQTRSKYNNELLVVRSNAYKQAVAEAEQAGRNDAAAYHESESKKLRLLKDHQIQKEAVSYYNNLLEKTKDQARIKADSDFSRLLADERSAIAPRADREIKAEHAKHIEERRLATVASLNALTLDAEKELVMAAAERLGLNLGSNEPAFKKVKVDQRKARPAPITPLERPNSAASNTSSSSRKRVYSPSEVAVKTPLPARDDQKTPTPADARPAITTITFDIKQESPLPQTFVTPSTPSVIQDAVNLAQDIGTESASQTPLRNLASSIHNKANHMAIDVDNINYRNIFPPGIPAPPSNPSLPPQMS
ncbi:hypothetical protein V8E53_011666 [Lactarius tabidus]